MHNAMQMQVRRIGKVHVIDFRGEVAGPWAMRARQSLSHLLSNQMIENLLIDLRDLKTVDSLGAKAIIDPIGENTKCGLVAGRGSVMDMFQHIDLKDRVKILNSENDVLDFFGQEFVEQGKELEAEKRAHQRIKTALPLEFSWTDEDGREIWFHAIVTDLSEGGLFAEYLDLAEAELVGQKIDPYDFKMLQLVVKLPGLGELHAKGKVVRTTWHDQIGLGIEFYQLKEDDRIKLRQFLQ